MTFSVTWRSPDDEIIPPDMLPADVRSMFDLAAASATGSGKPTAAHCTYPAGGSELVCEFQNPDGGFADTREGVRRQDGWVRGYEEPQGLSNTFATWFRWIAIAMIDDCLWPGRRDWHFRRMVGIGYRKPR